MAGIEAIAQPSGTGLEAGEDHAMFSRPTPTHFELHRRPAGEPYWRATRS